MLISQFLKEKIPIVPHIPIHEMHGTKHFKELLYKVLANINKGRRKINEDEEIKTNTANIERSTSWNFLSQKMSFSRRKGTPKEIMNSVARVAPFALCVPGPFFCLANSFTLFKTLLRS